MYKIWIAGSTHRTKQVAATIKADKKFKIELIITPQPRQVGRKQTTVINPLHQFALDHQIKTILVDKKIDQQVNQQLKRLAPPDLLIVVDFGFLIPDWLLTLPQKASLNIHPSLLPKWRGSSPGQNVILHGETDSAVTLMQIVKQMDAGPILVQLPFEVKESWHSNDYYQHAFDLICRQLTTYLVDFLEGKITPQPQPLHSPTPLATKITKDQAFFSWDDLKKAMETGEKAKTIERASKAYYPWPKLWTKVPTSQGEKRLIIHQAAINNRKLVLDQVQLEGKDPTHWQTIKANILK